MDLHVAAGHAVPSYAKKRINAVAAEERRWEKESQEKFGKVFSEKWRKSEPAREKATRVWLKRYKKLLEKDA